MKKVISILLTMMMICQGIGISHTGAATKGQTGELEGLRQPSHIKMEYESDNSDENLPKKWMLKEAAEDIVDYKAECTPVKDQGEQGTCWIFATYGSLESHLKKMTGAEYDFSENHAKFALTNTSTDQKNPYSFDYKINEGGNIWMSTAYLTRGEMGGPVLEKDDRYNDKGYKRKLSVTKAKPVTDHYVTDVKMLGELPYSTDTKNWWKKTEYKNYIKDMKSMLKNYGALYTSIHYDSWYEKYFEYSDGTVGMAYYRDYRHMTDQYEFLPYFTNHAVTIVGWDDSFPKTRFMKGCRPEENGAFLVKNSWGPYAENGYFWISYEDYFCAASVIQNVETRSEFYDHLYEYDTLGCTSTRSYRYGTKVVYMNSFQRKTTKQQEVTSVGTYFTEKGLTANVYVSPTRDASGLKKVASKKITDQGFHVINFETPVLLTDNKYLVAIELVSDTKDYIEVPIEEKWNGFSSQAKAKKGESYWGSTISNVKKGNYKQLTSYDDKACNACIKAYTKDTGVTLKSVNKAEVTGLKDLVYADGDTDQEPVVMVGGVVLEKGKDYRIQYTNKDVPGTAKIMIIGNGDYCGSTTKTYQVAPAATKLTSASTSKAGSLDLKYKKVEGATGYQIFLKKEGETKYTWKKNTKNTSTTVTGLESREKYYIKVRTYVTIDNKKVYGKMSSWWARTIQ